MAGVCKGECLGRSPEDGKGGKYFEVECCLRSEFVSSFWSFNVFWGSFVEILKG